MSRIKQCSEWICTVTGTLGRYRLKPGDVFWVTTPDHKNEEIVAINRKGRGSIGSGVRIEKSVFLTHFIESE